MLSNRERRNAEKGGTRTRVLTPAQITSDGWQVTLCDPI